MTLAFLAEVEERRLDDLSERLGRAAAKRTAFETAIAGGGAFPNAGRARVLWAGLDLDERGRTELDRLATGCRAAANRAGIPVDGQRFRPHVTVARLGRPAEVSNWVRLLDAYAGPRWTRDRIALVASHLGEGPRGRPRTMSTWSEFTLGAGERPSAGPMWPRLRRVKIAVARETRDGEARVAMVPELVGKLTGLGYEVVVEPGAGEHALIADEEYEAAGAVVDDDGARRRRRWWCRCSRSETDAVRRLRRGAATVSFLPTGQEPEIVAALRDGGVTSFAMELVPRISRAQSMDALSSQALVVRLPLRDRRGRDAAPVLPAEHDRRRHRAAGRGRRARRRRRRAAGDRDREAARRGRQGVRRARGRRRGDPLDGRAGDRPGAGHPRGCGRLRPRDDRGAGRAADGAAGAVRRRTRTR